MLIPERMTYDNWKQILLTNQDKIIYNGQVVTLVAIDLGYGVVEVTRELPVEQFNAGMFCTECGRLKENAINPIKIDQIEGGYTYEELALAAACYALPAASRKNLVQQLWPFALEEWKPIPNDRFQELIKAGAFIAEAIHELHSDISKNSP